MEKKPNIIFVTFDNGRADHLSFNGYGKKTTPFLDSLAKKGVCFKNAFSTGPGSPLSFIGIFTSTYPLDHGGYSYVDRPRVLFPEALREAGYTTVGVHSSPYLADYFGYNRGWDKFLYLNYFKKNTAAASPISPGLRKETAKAKVLKKTAESHSWLKKRIPFLAVIFRIIERTLLFVRKLIKDSLHFRPAFFIAEKINAEVETILDGVTERPLFLWVHYMDSHNPYGLFGRTGHGLVRKVKYYICDWAGFLFGDFPPLLRIFVPLLKSTYDDSLSYVDENIKNLLDSLKQRGILNDNAIVVITSDHGEVFLEHGEYGHPQMLYNPNIRIPLIFYSPNGLDAKKVEKPVSLIDVAPTILDFAGAKKPESFRGENIFEGERDVIVQASESEGDLTGHAFTGIAMVRGGYKFMLYKKEKSLFPVNDAEEIKSVYNEKRDIADEMEQRLAKAIPYMDNFYQHE